MLHCYSIPISHNTLALLYFWASRNGSRTSQPAKQHGRHSYSIHYIPVSCRHLMSVIPLDNMTGLLCNPETLSQWFKDLTITCQTLFVWNTFLKHVWTWKPEPANGHIVATETEVSHGKRHLETYRHTIVLFSPTCTKDQIGMAQV